MESAFEADGSPNRQHQEDIAIVGMSCIFPGAPDLQTYWKNIISKVDAVSDPSDQWGAEFIYDPDTQTNDRIYCKRGGYLKELAEFSPLQYGVMPASIHGAEPGHFLALRAAYESLADAGYLDKPIDGAGVEVILGRGPVLGPADMNLIQHGVVIDQTIRILKHLHPEHSEEELEAIKQELRASLPPFNPDTVPGWVSNIITGRINNRLDFMGTNYTLDAACASSLIAVDRGIQDLRSGRCDMALVGGIEPCMPPLGLLVFCKINALARDGKIRPFDKDASGTLLGEGVGIIVLKRKQDAERDGDRIYAVIKGVGVSSDGRGAGLLAPRLEGQVLALKRAYEEAGIPTESVGLIEAHGTAVPLGDITEAKALARVFGPRRGAYPSCALGSVKSMVSHLVHAAGIAGLIKTALALYHNVLPPTLNCDEVNPELELEKTPFYLNTETRPWIDGGESPRRAGVSAFGFGGINAHVVLEQHPGAAGEARTSLLDKWETEVCIIQGESREGLIASCQKLLNWLSREREVKFKDLAYSLNCPPPQAAYRLAVVANSLSDLEKKLTDGLRKLSDPHCATIRNAKGIYFFERPLGREGKLAFMFPGHGSQYVNMLSDLCIHFPEVRACFDKLDQVFLRSNRAPAPSHVLFPPPGDRAMADISQEYLFSQLAFASSVMCTADLSLLELLTSLEIRPDALVGHSNGEFIALMAAGAIRVEEEDRIMEYALHAQQVYDLFADQIPTAKILAVGGGDTAVVRSLLERSGGALQLTIDNCPHQMILCGPEDSVTDAFDYLRERGVICNLAPFNHAAHSPLFQLICDQSADFYHRINIVAPRMPVYSCTTARLHSQDPAQIRQLTMNHLARPIRFRETIEAMYEAGTRIFVEVGPKGILTGFVNDILGDGPYAAIPSNSSSRAGVTQLNHMVGLLAAHHVSMRLDYLYKYRSPARISFDLTGGPDQHEKNKPYWVKLSLECPLLKLQSNGATKRSNSLGSVQETAPPSSHQQNGQAKSDSLGGAKETAPPSSHQQNGQARSEPPAHSPTSQAVLMVDPIAPRDENLTLPAADDHDANTAPTSSLVGHVPRSLVMDEYLLTMEQFLKTQQDVVEAFLNAGRQQTPPGGRHEKQTPSFAIRQEAPAAYGPFSINVRSLIVGQEATATCRLDLEEHIFLRDHTLGRSPSTLDETLMALSIVPLTVTMEILAQVASLLIPAKRLVGMKAFRAHRWIEVDEGGCALFLTARVKKAESPVEVNVQIVSVEGSSNVSRQGLIAEGTMIFADEYPAVHRYTPLICRQERPHCLRPEKYYDSMFHGPCFRSVVSIDQFDQHGMQATLKNPTDCRLFRSHKNSDLLTDPVLLDGAGQVIGFWTLDRFEDGGAIFPIGFEAMEIYRPFSHGNESITCAARINSFADGRIRSDIDLINSEGEMLARIVAWEDMRALGWTQLFNRFLLFPDVAVYSAPWPQPVSHFQASLRVQCCAVSDGPGGIWPHLVASMILNRQERAYWARLGEVGGDRRAWLLGRLAAKDAARLFIKNRYGLSLRPADIEIVNDEYGRLSLASELIEKLGGNLSIAISESEGRAAAIAGQFEGCRGIGMDIANLDRSNGELQQTALAPGERDLLATCPTAQKDEWLRRSLCAKKAAAKALGSNMAESNLNLRIADLRIETGEVLVAVNGAPARPLQERMSESLIVRTGREEDLIFAVSLS